MKNASKFKNIVLGSMIAVAVASAPLATFAHENEKSDDSHKGVKVEARANINSNGKFHFPFWGRHFHWGWFKHKHHNGTNTNNGNTTSTVPVLSNIDTSKIDQDEATITWTTDVNSSTYIWYGTNSSVDTSGNTTLTKSGTTKSHSIHLTGLNDDTKYYFVIGSGTNAGKANSGTMSFTTTDENADTTNPVISNISSNTSSASTTITWKTDEAATSKVYYSTNTPVDTGSASTVVNNSLTTDHSLTISSLSNSTLYHYKIESKDSSGNTAITGESSFTTSS